MSTLGSAPARLPAPPPPIRLAEEEQAISDDELAMAFNSECGSRGPGGDGVSSPGPSSPGMFPSLPPLYAVPPKIQYCIPDRHYTAADPRHRIAYHTAQ